MGTFMQVFRRTSKVGLNIIILAVLAKDGLMLKGSDRNLKGTDTLHKQMKQGASNFEGRGHLGR